MAISIALFGLSASGVYVFLMRDRWRDRPIETLLGTHALAYAAVTGGALAILVRIRVDLTYTPANIAWMSVVYLVSALPFFFGGSTISIAIARLSGNVNAVYAADLLGAGAGCVALIPAVNVFGAPGAIVTSALMGTVAAICFTARVRPAAAATAAAVLAAAGLGAFAVGVTKNHQKDQVLFSKWNSFSRIGVYSSSFNAWSLSPRYTGPVPENHLMDIDSAAATQIIRLDGDVKNVSYLRYELTALGYRLFDKEGFDALVIGTGGGRDLLSALVFGARHIDGVEINPIIVNDVMRGKFRDYSGGVYDRPGVTIAVEDGRSFVRRSPKQYDVIQASLVDTWAATAAGAYSLSENSLYTVEAFDDYLDHLSDRGVLSVSRWVFDGLRLISLAQEACARRGWNAADHVAIIQQDRVATFLLKKTPFTPAETAVLAKAAADLDFTVMYLPGRSVQTFGDSRDEYVHLLLAPDRQAFYRDF